MEINCDCIIGIDPGRSGGLAIWRPNAKVEVKKMPKELMDLRDYFSYIKDICDSPIIFIEKVQGRPDDLNNFGKVFRVDKMKEDFARLKTIIEIVDIPYIQVHPMSWQATLKLRKSGEEKKERKNRYKKAAATYYPEVKATLWNADALLLVHFGRFKKQYNPEWIFENLPKRLHDQIIFDFKAK